MSPATPALGGDISPPVASPSRLRCSDWQFLLYISLKGVGGRSRHLRGGEDFVEGGYFWAVNLGGERLGEAGGEVGMGGGGVAHGFFGGGGGGGEEEGFILAGYGRV